MYILVPYRHVKLNAAAGLAVGHMSSLFPSFIYNIYGLPPFPFCHISLCYVNCFLKSMQVKLIIRKERFCGHEREQSILFLASFHSLLKVVWTCLGIQWSLLITFETLIAPASISILMNYMDWHFWPLLSRGGPHLLLFSLEVKEQIEDSGKMKLRFFL